MNRFLLCDSGGGSSFSAAAVVLVVSYFILVINRITVEWSQLPICLFHHCSQCQCSSGFSWFWNLVCNVHNVIKCLLYHCPMAVEMSKMNTLRAIQGWGFWSCVWEVFIEDRGGGSAVGEATMYFGTQWQRVSGGVQRRSNGKWLMSYLTLVPSIII